jgi:hypothetical protein
MDNGPIEGHSLFTGCLLEALSGGLKARTGYPVATARNSHSMCNVASARTHPRGRPRISGRSSSTTAVS